MKQLIQFISIILFFLGLWYLWSHYDEISASIDKTVSEKTGYKSRQEYDAKKDPSSQEFRDELAKKLYGTKNYEDMKDPDMASRIYNERMNRPTERELREQKAKRR